MPFEELTTLLARGLVRLFADDPHAMRLDAPTIAANESPVCLDSSATQSVTVRSSTLAGTTPMMQTTPAPTRLRKSKPKKNSTSTPRVNHAAIAAQIAALPTLSMRDLWKLWDEYVDRRPSNHHRTYVESRLAYRIQERAYGGLAPATVRLLEQIGETGEIPGQRRKTEQGLVAGTVLVRSHNGLEHRVTVMTDGRFDWCGQPYKSLSAIANAITGSHCSGPRFFNLALRGGKGEKGADQ